MALARAALLILLAADELFLALLFDVEVDLEFAKIELAIVLFSDFGVLLPLEETAEFDFAIFGILGKFAITLELVLRNDNTSTDWFLLENGDEVAEELLLDECEDLERFEVFRDPAMGELLFLEELLPCELDN